MADSEIPAWLKSLPLAPVYRPTETEFADPIAFISRMEREAAAFGICKVIPPLPRPSKRFVLANLTRSLARSPELGAAAATPSPESAVFTTRQQELGSRRRTVRKQVWQSGEVYTLEQFEAKSRSFARTHLGSHKELSPLLTEALFWKAVSEKPLYVEYANDVPGSGFAAPEAPLRFSPRRRKQRDGSRSRCRLQASSSSGAHNHVSSGSEWEGTAGWRMSNSPWNLQAIARAAGSLTRFMPDDVPGVTSPMIYIGMLFSWFAWHVEDHELHSLNYLHMGSPKTWYAAPGEYASSVEEIVRVQGYGGNMDRLAAFTMLGEKTTVLSPEVFLGSGVPCCRLVQHPGEFVVTFPRAYHVGFSHGFNCGEAANFATPQWLKVAKEAALRRAAMNHLPMLSHQQLLYMLTMSFMSRIPRDLLPGVRSSRLRDRKKEETEILVKKAFLDDITTENRLLRALLEQEPTFYAVLWEPELLPSPSAGSHLFSSSHSEAHRSMVDHNGREMDHCSDMSSLNRTREKCHIGDMLHEAAANLTSVPCQKSFVESQKIAHDVDNEICNTKAKEDMYADEGDFPACLDVDSGSLPCVSCGILGYPFMAIVQPSERAIRDLFLINSQEFDQKSGRSGCMNLLSSLPRMAKELHSDDMEARTMFHVQENQDSTHLIYPICNNHLPLTEGIDTRDGFTLVENNFNECSSHNARIHEIRGKMSRSMSGHQIDSISNSMLQFNDNTSDLSMPVKYVNDGDGNTLRRPKQQVGILGPPNYKYAFSKVDYSHCLHPCDELKENAGDVNIKDGAIPGNDTHSINCLGRGSIYGTYSLLGEPIEKDGNMISRKWNKSNGFVRPRVFCLQHALEIVEFLKSKGGANVLITCHSDFLIIKAHAVVVAEEIGVKFKYKEVQLENASAEDLNLINFSIDVDEHEDWTSKLGLNLKYCVNLKNQLPTDPEQLTFALGKIFSDASPISVGSNLKWRSRKSRTPYEVIGTIQLEKRNDANILKDKPQRRNSSAKEIQVYQSRRNGFNNIARKQDVCPRNDTYKDSSTGKEMEIADDWDIHKSVSVRTDLLSDEFGNGNTGNLLTAPVCNTENTLRHQDGCTVERIEMPFDVNFPDSEHVTVPANSHVEVCKPCIGILPDEFPTLPDPLNSDCHQAYTKCSSVGSAELYYDPQPEEPNTDEPESVVDLVFPEFDNTKLQDEIGFLANTNLVHEHNTAEHSSCESPCIRTVGYSEDLPEDAVVQMPKSECSFCPAVFSDQSTTQVLPSCNLLHAGVSTADDTGMENGSAFENFESQKVIYSKENTLQPENHFIDDAANKSSGKLKELSGTRETEKGKSSDSVRPSCFVEVSSDSPVDISSNPANVVLKCSEKQEVEASANRFGHYIGNDDVKITRIVYKSYFRRTKRKREAEQITVSHHVNDSFVRGPCEGLRPRAGRVASEMIESITVDKVAGKETKSVKGTLMRGGSQGKDKTQGPYKCDLEGCCMFFKSMRELKLHKQDRCTHKGCWKRVSSHKYLMRHERVHDDKRPFRCPWKGCNMSFKWEWARTEHIRLHTGERPYKCNVLGCELTFRYVSDFCRHRRKTGHSVNSPG